MVDAETFSRFLSQNEVVGLIFRLTIFGAVTYFTIKWIVVAIDPTRKQKVQAQKQAEELMKQIGVKNVKLSEYEMSIAAHLVDPVNMHATWSDSTGLDDVITDLKDTVILPIKKKHLFENSRLLQPPKGILKVYICENIKNLENTETFCLYRTDVFEVGFSRDC